MNDSDEAKLNAADIKTYDSVTGAEVTADRYHCG